MASAVYGYHLRVTKKDQALLKKQPQSSWQTLAVQKTGLLFTTPELKRLSTAWESSSKAYEACQDAIVSQAVEVARTYIGPMQVGRHSSLHSSTRPPTSLTACLGMATGGRPAALGAGRAAGTGTSRRHAQLDAAKARSQQRRRGSSRACQGPAASGGGGGAGVGRELHPE